MKAVSVWISLMCESCGREVEARVGMMPLPNKEDPTSHVLPTAKSLPYLAAIEVEEILRKPCKCER